MLFFLLSIIISYLSVFIKKYIPGSIVYFVLFRVKKSQCMKIIKDLDIEADWYIDRLLIIVIYCALSSLNDDSLQNNISFWLSPHAQTINNDKHSSNKPPCQNSKLKISPRGLNQGFTVFVFMTLLVFQ